MKRTLAPLILALFALGVPLLAALGDSTTNQGQGDTAALVAVPTGAAADQIAILACTIDNVGATFETGDWPSGFTELGEDQITGDGQRVGYAWKRLTGADAGNYGALGDLDNSGTSTAGWVCQAALFTGRDTTDPPVISTASINNGTNASPVTISANGVTALDGDDLLWIGAPDVRAAAVGNGMTAPSGYSEIEDQESTSDSGWANLSMAVSLNVAAGATGTVSGTFTLTSSTAAYAARLIRIPAAAGGGGGGGSAVSFGLLKGL